MRRTCIVRGCKRARRYRNGMCQACSHRTRYRDDPEFRESRKAGNRRSHRRNRERNLSRFHDRNIRMKIAAMRKLGMRCACCGLCGPWWVLTLDHIRPLNHTHGKRVGARSLYKRILESDVKNIQVLCSGCNSSKHRNRRCRIDHTRDYETISS